MNSEIKAFCVAVGASFAVYAATLAPTVTLEWSGSLACAADYMGVANSPGYPVWTLIGWLFDRLFGFVTFHGQPNPAWATNLMSAVFGALSCGIIAWLVATLAEGRRAVIAGVSAGLMFGLGRVVWSQAVITETETLHVFFVLATLAMAYRARIVEASFLAGLAILTSYSSLVLLPLLVVAFLFNARRLKHPLLTLLGSIFSFLLSMSFLALLPIASDRNPPFNWGYARTPEGFHNIVSRGQFERIDLLAEFAYFTHRPGDALRLLHTWVDAARAEFGVTLLLAIAGLLLFHKSDCRTKAWLGFLLIALLAYGVVVTLIMHADRDIQTLFIARTYWISSFAIIALFAGYGLIALFRLVPRVAFATACVLPLIPFSANWLDVAQTRRWGGSEQQGHDFGWQFGAYQLEGAEAIRADMLDYPLGDYPPAMEPNAIFFGGTDPGRFVNTYLVFSAKVRPDVFMLTQNALADNTYMCASRDLYGDRIWIPAQMDSNAAFQEYVQGVQAGKIQAGADVSFAGGRVSVQGVQGVMSINGILAQKIFEANKGKHAFYVEESYVIPWMYPYVEPCGLILRLHAEPLKELPPETVKNDRAFWDWYAARLLSDPKFQRDVVARKTFSKLRSAIAGVYSYRLMFKEAEYAFKQAVALYPDSPEANFRLADIYMQQFRFTDAAAVIERFMKADPDNDKVREFIDEIHSMAASDVRRRQLEGILAKGGDVQQAVELIAIYHRMNLKELEKGLRENVLSQTNLPSTVRQELEAEL